MPEIKRNVAVSIGGAVHHLKAGTDTADIAGLTDQDMGRIRRAGGFGDDGDALDGQATDGTTGAAIDLDAMKVAELRDYAKTKALAVDLSLNKADLLAAIKTAEGQPQGETPVPSPAPAQVVENASEGDDDRQEAGAVGQGEEGQEAAAS